MARLRPGEWLVRPRWRSLGLLGRASWGVWGPRGWALSGAQEGQSAVAVELEEVVDGALEAPLGARGGLSA